MSLYEYKDTHFTRGERMQMVEEKFGSGMQFTNTPLAEGLLKELVNYDIVDAGISLAPRPGLQTIKAYIADASVPAAFAVDNTIVAAKEQAISLSDSRAQFLVAQKADGVADGYNLYVVTSTNTTVPHPVLNTGNAKYDDVPWYSYKVSGPILIHCKTPGQLEIHGMAVAQPKLFLQSGVYAWNENYYFFDQTNNKMVHTEWSSADDKYIFVSNTPKVITPKEAVSYGYNMMLSNPYTFSNVTAAAGSIIQFLGMMPYDANNALCLTPVVNQSLNFEIFYSVPLNAKYYIVVEWRTTEGTTWEQLKAFDTTFTTIGTINIPFSPPAENIIMRVSAYGYTDTTRNTYTDATLAVGFSFNKDDYGSTANTSPKTYTINAATGITYWKNRLVAWGIPEDQSILFMSDVNDPTYFPYPNNADTFDEPIKFATPFLDNLLVWTATKLYLITLGTDGTSWKKSCIQHNLTIADWDLQLIQIVKNMVFFRSGNYYYMIVPKSGSTTGELTLATISKPMYAFFDNFEQNCIELIKSVYNIVIDPTKISLLQYYNYLDFEDVHNVYQFKIRDAANAAYCEHITVDLLYNTINRNWRVYTMGSVNAATPYKQDMTRKGVLCMLNDGEIFYADRAIITNTDPMPMFQLLQYNNNSNEDYSLLTYTQTNPDVWFSKIHKWLNWQFIDTGYREHSSNFKKRYRELQFMLNNRSGKVLSFYTDFFIDGEQRRNHFTYNVIKQPGTLDGKPFNALTVEQVFGAPLNTPGTTVLGINTTDTDAWTLGVSEFPETALWKVRFPVSGKGYAPRMYILSHNEEPYDLLNLSWVYRSMYSR